LENWNVTPEVKLNKVAFTIKQNEDYIDQGYYEKATTNDWRNIPLNEG